jgi:sugar O-acyltransferase (sialic acid O-acetyltransferase NeuD family)
MKRAPIIKLAIIGAGDLGRQLAHHARQTGLFSVVGFFDDVAGAPRGDKILGPLAAIGESFQSEMFEQILIGIGYKHLAFRQRLYETLSPKIPFATLIHPDTIVDPTSSIGAGSVIYPGCVLDMNTVIEENVIVNIDCAIAHDSRIGTGCFLSPSVKIAGFVCVNPLTMLGIGTVVIDNLTIGSHIRTGAGAVVANNISEPGLYLGVPAKLRTQPSRA